jgi:hypothetical protein
MINPMALRPLVSYNITTSATSAASAAATTVGVCYVRLAATAACWVKFAATPVADKTTSVYLPAGVPEYVKVPASGVYKVAAIQDSAAGTLNITEMTD